MRCPDCGDRIQILAEQHVLECPACDRTVPVVQGIPRFVSQEHLASFGLQWNRFEIAHEDEDRATFQVKTGILLDELPGRHVLDAGCGGAA